LTSSLNFGSVGFPFELGIINIGLSRGKLSEEWMVLGRREKKVNHETDSIPQKATWFQITFPSFLCFGWSDWKEDHSNQMPIMDG